jgi:geranylgeranyl diphosphate synthase, type II
LAATSRFAFVEQVLERYRAATLQTLLALLPETEPRRYLYDLVRVYPRRGGKGLRPGLCIATCRTFGGSIDRVLRSAVAVELFHNAFLVHDDVEDESEKRRGEPTLAAAYGLGIAVNVGDAMNVLSLDPLMENLGTLGPHLSWRIFAEIQHMVRQSVEGQAMELGWVRDNACTLDDGDYLRMTLKKTCWYTCIHPCRIGALVATGGAIDPDLFNRFGYYLGAAFQIQDDLLNLVGDQAKYGKETAGDIWEGKRTLMLIHALGHCRAEERTRLERFLGRRRAERSERDVRWVFRLMQRVGSLDHASASARQLAEAALGEFTIAYGGQPESDDKRFIEDLILYMIEREL